MLFLLFPNLFRQSHGQNRIYTAAGLGITFTQSLFFNNTVFNEQEDERLVAVGDPTKVRAVNSFMCFGASDSIIGGIRDEIFIRDNYFSDNSSATPLCFVP